MTSKHLPSLRILQRKGALKRVDVSRLVRGFLNRGMIETKTLAEMLVVDFEVLFSQVIKDLKVPNPELFIKRFSGFKDLKIMGQLKMGGIVWCEIDEKHRDIQVMKKLSNHTSDLVRSWATFATAERYKGNLHHNFKFLEKFADDDHMGVRECAWMALRFSLMNDFSKAKPYLFKWAESPSFKIRRTAIEATRPRGVWCEHFPLLKERPELAQDLLDLCMEDSERYVQNSVGNWLNDASKSDPKFVLSYCKEWEKRSSSKSTEYIIKRAKRTMEKRT